MNKTEKITFRINEQLKQDYKQAIDNCRTHQNMTADLIAHIESKVEQDKKRNK